MNYSQEIEQIENYVFREGVDLEESSMAIEIGFGKLLAITKNILELNLDDWILCEEALPLLEGKYLGSYEIEDYKFVLIGTYVVTDDDEGYWLDQTPIAWMPLPVPFKS